MSHPSLTAAQAERLEMLIEECAEVIQAATKTLRHGYLSHHPDDPAKSPNSTELQRELADLDAVRWGMALNQDPAGQFTPSAQVNSGWTRKLNYTHHQERF